MRTWAWAWAPSANNTEVVGKKMPLYSGADPVWGWRQRRHGSPLWGNLSYLWDNSTASVGPYWISPWVQVHIQVQVGICGLPNLSIFSDMTCSEAFLWDVRTTSIFFSQAQYCLVGNSNGLSPIWKQNLYFPFQLSVFVTCSHNFCQKILKFQALSMNKRPLPS